MQRFADLPVCVEVPGRLGDEVTAFAEAEAGWQVVGGAGPLVPVLTVAAQVVPGAACVVVREGPLPPDEVREALLAGALDVISWPADRGRLLSLPARLRPAALAPPAPVLRIGGARGGVGTSTVALAVGATVAWSGRSALVVGDTGLVRLAGVGPWHGPGLAEVSALGAEAAEEVGGVARAVPGVAGLSVLAGANGSSLVPSGWPFDLVVVDVGAGAASSCDLVVGAADRSLEDVPAGAGVVVVEHGPLDRAGVRRCLGRAPSGWLPYSARVARAGLAGRVPSALPGSWVSALRKVLAAVTV